MNEIKEMLMSALKVARREYENAPTPEDKKEWEILIKSCIKELNATHGKIIQ